MSDAAVIQLKGVDIFQEKHLVLANVDLEVKAGEFAYLVGQTGSGKTSLLKVLYGALHVGSGDGSAAGFNLKTLRNRQVPYLRRKIGVVFQDFQLLTDRTIGKNLLFVLKATGWKGEMSAKERVNDVLEKVGLRTKVNKMPYELSGGEQQRVTIARALLNDPEIILADEPTAHLDPATSRDIVGLLQQIAANGTAVVMATHNYAMLKEMPARIIKCENGVVVSNAAPDTVY